MKYWTPDTFEISSFKNGLNERVNQTYKGSGSDITGNCTYTYNELGFRGDSIKKEGFKVMALGCSHTEGVGVNNDETWPAQFAKLIPNGVNINFGTGGRSGDFVVRCLFSYYDLIKPDSIFKVSYVGFLPQSFKASELVDKKITLLESNELLTEVNVFSQPIRTAKQSGSALKAHIQSNKFTYAGIGGLLGLFLIAKSFKK